MRIMELRSSVSARISLPFSPSAFARAFFSDGVRNGVKIPSPYRAEGINGTRLCELIDKNARAGAQARIRAIVSIDLTRNCAVALRCFLSKTGEYLSNGGSQAGGV